MRVVLGIFFIGFFYASALYAENNNAEKALGWEKFKVGDYYGARSDARTGTTAEDAFLACRSGLVIGGFFEKEHYAVESLHQAITDCETALKRDPSHRTARLSLAIAIGFEGKRLKSPKLAKKTRAMFEQLIKEDPNDAIAVASLAGWHSEVAAEGFLARLALGARNKKAEEAFKAAFAMDDSNLIMRVEYAKFLARGSKKRYPQAIAEIKDILNKKPAFAFEIHMQDKALNILKAIQVGDKKIIRQRIKDATGFPDIELQKKMKPYVFADDSSTE